MEKKPFVRIAKRENASYLSAWLIRLLAFVLALILGGIVFMCAGANPISAYKTIIEGSLGKAHRIRQTVKVAIPLLGTAVALAPCFRMKYWNCGAEGQITMGAVGASFFAIYFGAKWPSILLLPIMGLAGIVLGALWSLLPAIFKARWGTNETLFTLMLNYIAIGIVSWLQGGPWEGMPGSQIIPTFKESAVLPSVLGVHCGWIMVLILMFFMYFYLNFTKHGYEVAVLGESENTARYAGMKVRTIILRTALLSGAISGLVGFMVCSGTDQTLFANVANGVGFTAITIAWLSQLNPFAMLIISMMLAILSKGSSALQSSLSVPASVSGIMTGILLMTLLGCEFFINYRLIFNFKKEVL